ncbi:hypothetical protein VTK56DRAFT_1020 [Thermocarpiscus australiensis]
MLLAKPSSILRPPDLGQCYGFAPPLKFDPDQFTKRPIRPVQLHQDEHERPHHLQNKSPLQPSRAKSFCLAPSGGAVEDTVKSRFYPLESLSRPREQSQTQSHDLAEDSDKRFDGAAEVRRVPKMAVKPPFPDSSPSDAMRPSIQAQGPRGEASSPISPSDGQMRAQNRAVALTNVHELELSHRRQSAENIMQRSVSNTTHGRQYPRYNQQTEYGRSDNDGRGYEQHHHPQPSTVGSRDSVRDARDRSQNQMANRPLREMAQENRFTGPSLRSRPDSRSSNVSKRRYAPVSVLMLCRILTV